MKCFRAYRYAMAAAGLLLAGSCSTGQKPRPEPAEPSLQITVPAVTNGSVRPQRIPLLNTPRRMREDYVYPEPYTRQDFKWSGSYAEWHIRFTPQRYGYAGVAFIRPYDLTDFREDGVLQFRLKPARMARYLSFGLVDGKSRDPRVLTDLAIDEEGGTESSDWVVIRIALGAFPRKGIAIEDRDPSETFTFDWTDVEEIRFITEGRNMPNQEITISQMLITR
jgi:hypothetical protein